MSSEKASSNGTDKYEDINRHSSVSPEDISHNVRKHSSHTSLACQINADLGQPVNYAQVTARLRNPLAGVPRATLLADVEDFAHQKGLSEVTDMLMKGALVAQNPVGWLTLERGRP